MNSLFSGYIERSRGKYRKIRIDKVWINRNTPVGESADFFERKPYGGRRNFSPILEVKDDKVCQCYGFIHSQQNFRWEFKLDPKLDQFLVDNQIQIGDQCGMVSVIRTNPS